MREPRGRPQPVGLFGARGARGRRGRDRDLALRRLPLRSVSATHQPATPHHDLLGSPKPVVPPPPPPNTHRHPFPNANPTSVSIKDAAAGSRYCTCEAAAPALRCLCGAAMAVTPGGCGWRSLVFGAAVMCCISHLRPSGPTNPPPHPRAARRHQINDAWNAACWPLVPGHEVVGRIAAVGPAVANGLKVGMMVGIGVQRGSCGDCGQCNQGREHTCPKITKTYAGPGKVRSPSLLLRGSAFTGTAV